MMRIWEQISDAAAISTSGKASQERPHPPTLSPEFECAGEAKTLDCSQAVAVEVDVWVPGIWMSKHS